MLSIEHPVGANPRGGHGPPYALTAYPFSRLAEPTMFRNVGNLGQARILVATQRGVDHVISDDARFVNVVTVRSQRLLGEALRFFEAQMHSFVPDSRHGCLRAGTVHRTRVEWITAS